MKISLRILFFITAVLMAGSCTKESISGLMPGTKKFDVTNPPEWGGDQTLAATPDDPSDDDAP